MTADNATVQLYTDGTRPIVAIVGDADLADADELADCLSVFNRDDSIVLDLTEATFIDSSVLGLLAQTYRRGVKVASRGAHGPVLRVLEISGIDTLLDTEQ